MLARKPPMLVMVALANKMARVAWALLSKGGVYQAPARHRLAAASREVVNGVGGTKDRYGATSVRRDQKNQAHGERFERGPVMWI